MLTHPFDKDGKVHSAYWVKDVERMVLFMFQYLEGKYYYLYVGKTQQLISCTVQLVCIFVSAYVYVRFCHDAVHMSL